MIVRRTFVHGDLALVNLVRRETDQHGILPLLSSNDDGVTSEETEGVHRRRVEGGNGVVIGSSLVNDQSVRANCNGFSKENVAGLE